MTFGPGANGSGPGAVGQPPSERFHMTSEIFHRGSIALAIAAALLFPPLIEANADETESQTAEADRTLVVGVVSHDPKKQFPKLEAMAAYLAERLKDHGIVESAAVVAGSHSEMLTMLRDGTVDVVSETAFSAIHYAEQAGAEILLREWKKGVGEYHSVLIVRRDSGIASLEDLRGKVVAFEDPGSTTGFLLPLATLRQRGLETASVNIGTRPQPTTVGYGFATEEVNIVTMVSRGIVGAGAISNQDWEDFTRTPDAMKDELAILHESASLLRSTILVRAGLSPAVQAQLKHILLAMDSEQNGRDVLAEYYKVAKYDEIDGAAADSLANARTLYPLVAAEIR